MLFRSHETPFPVRSGKEAHSRELARAGRVSAGAPRSVVHPPNLPGHGFRLQGPARMTVRRSKEDSLHRLSQQAAFPTMTPKLCQRVQIEHLYRRRRPSDSSEELPTRFYCLLFWPFCSISSISMGEADRSNSGIPLFRGHSVLSRRMGVWHGPLML